MNLGQQCPTGVLKVSCHNEKYFGFVLWVSANQRKNIISFAHHTLTMLNDSISPGPPSAAKKNPSSVPISTSQLLGRSAVPPCKGGRQRFVDGATMESSFTFINQVMVRSTQQYLRHHNGSGQFGGTFSDRFHRPPWLRQQQWECLTSNFAKSLHPGWQVEPPCSTRALNFTTGWPRLRWSEYLLGFWHKEQHDRVLS